MEISDLGFQCSGVQVFRCQVSGVMQGFLDKGRMQPLLEAMPVKIIINDRTALYGPALYLEAVKEGTTGGTDGR